MHFRSLNRLSRFAFGPLSKVPFKKSDKDFLNGADQDRTGDLMLAKHALSQLSYCPDIDITCLKPRFVYLGIGRCKISLREILWAQVDSNH